MQDSGYEISKETRNIANVRWGFILVSIAFASSLAVIAIGVSTKGNIDATYTGILKYVGMLCMVHFCIFYGYMTAQLGKRGWLWAIIAFVLLPLSLLVFYPIALINAYKNNWFKGA